MEKVRFARALFHAISSASLAILKSLLWRSPQIGLSLPEWIPLRQVWIDGAALLLLVASAGLCFSRSAPLPSACWTISAYLLLGRGFQFAPDLLQSSQSLRRMVASFCEALTSVAGAYILYVMLRAQPGGSQLPIAEDRIRCAWREPCLASLCIFSTAARTLPTLPYTSQHGAQLATRPPEPAYLTGLAHVAAGFGIVVGVLPRLAATLEAIMMSLFGLLVWVPSFFARPRPSWATPPQNQWSELVVNLVLAAAAWVVVTSWADRPWIFAPRPRA